MCVKQGSPDLRAAKEVADYLGTFHHEFYFTVQVLVTVKIGKLIHCLLWFFTVEVK